MRDASVETASTEPRNVSRKRTFKTLKIWYYVMIDYIIQVLRIVYFVYINSIYLLRNAFRKNKR